MSEEHVFETISREYYDLTASEKKTADYLMAHQEESQYMSIAELAEECGVAEATVSRFCRRLGYKGYNAFELAIANSTARMCQDTSLPAEARSPESDSLEEMARSLYDTDNGAMLQTLALLSGSRIKAAAELLEQARWVYCMGQGGYMLIAAEAI